MTTYSLTAMVWKDGKAYVAECLEVGTISQGESTESAIKNLAEATDLYLSLRPNDHLRKVKLIKFELDV